MSDYYVMIHDQQQGPFSDQEIMNKNLPSNTFVCKKGSRKWENLCDIPELNIPSLQHSGNPQTSPTPTPKVDPGMFNNPFDFEGRIRRMEYGISLIIYVFIAGLINAFIAAGHGANAIIGIVYIPLIWFYLAQGAKRCHDMNHSGFYQLIPLYVFWMIFQDGEKGSSQYGLSPK